LRFAWPHFLWLLLLIPILVMAYRHALKRRSRTVPLYSSLSLLREALDNRRRWRRHLPPLLMVLALVPLIVAMARPSSSLTLPSDNIVLVLAMDVSLSMRATDMKPNRISAAKEAAKAFIKDLPKSIKVGIVAFAGTATVVQTPTDNHDDLIAAIDAFQLQRGTATGSALLSALHLLLPDSGVDLEANIFRDKPADARVPPTVSAAPVPVGSYNNGAIILLSDGRRTTGADPAKAAQQAADRGVKVYTIGFGTKDGTAQAPGMDDNWSFYLKLDETALKQMASITKGDYSHAGSSADLRKIYESFNAKFSLERRETEISFAFVATALLLALVAGYLSLRWMRGS
jgi:Ca-activated chloride channel homolog